MEPRTTITYNGQTYPFYKTNRGNVDFENAGFTMNQVLEGQSQATLALVYFHMRDCAKRANTPIEDSFEQFIDASDPDVIEVFKRLAEARDAGNQQAPKTGRKK
jgi:hypothetical protein